MPAFSSQTIAILALIALMALLAMLRILASAIHNQTFIHDLRVRVFRLRLRHLALERAARDMIDPADLPDDQDDLIRFVRTGHIETLHGADRKPQAAQTPANESAAPEPLARAA